MDEKSQAVLYVKRFAVKIFQLMKEQGYHFELLIGAGDSGLVMLKLATLVYEHLGMPVPSGLELPIVRYRARTHACEENRFDNSSLIVDVEEQLEKLPALKNVLFVDDEIKGGMTVKTTIELLIKCLERAKRDDEFSFIIVAEDHGFTHVPWGNISPPSQVDVKIFHYASGREGVYHVIFNLISPEINRVFGKSPSCRSLSSRNKLHLLLDLPIKEIKDDQPVFTHMYNRLAKQEIPNFDKVCAAFSDKIRQLVYIAIEDYKDNQKFKRTGQNRKSKPSNRRDHSRSKQIEQFPIGSFKRFC